jgi:hypothetical protein
VAFSVHGGLVVDYLVPTSPSVPALTDRLVPGSSSAPGQIGYLAVAFGATPAHTDYVVGDAVSRLAGYTPAATLYLVVEHFDAHLCAIGVNVGTGQYNPMTLATVIDSTEINTLAGIGAGISSTEHHTMTPVALNVGTLHQDTEIAIGANIGTASAGNPVPIGATIETVSRKLDVEVSIVTEELQEVEEEP